MLTPVLLMKLYSKAIQQCEIRNKSRDMNHSVQKYGQHTPRAS